MAGMDLKGVADFANKAFDGIQTLLEAGKEIGSIIQLVTATKERIEAMASQNRGPSQEEWDAQTEMLRQLQDDLHSDDH